MNILKRSLTSLMILLFVFNCFGNEKVEDGFWYGKQNTEDFNYSLLFQVKEGRVIHYFKAVDDTLNIEEKWGKFLGEGFSEYEDLHFKTTVDSLKLYRNGSDQPLSYLTKANDNLFLFDILGDNNIKFDLPEGVGDEALFGTDYNLYSAVYIFKDQGQLKVSLCDTILPLKEELLFEEIIMNKRLAFIQKNHFLPQISLIVDKDISVEDFNMSIKCFKAAGYMDVDILLKNIDYEYASYITMKLPELTKEDRSRFFKIKKSIYLKANPNAIIDFSRNQLFDPRKLNPGLMPGPPPNSIDWIAKQDLFVVKFDNGEFKLNNEVISEKKLQSEFKRRLQSKFGFYIHYYITADSTIEDLVKLKSILLNARNKVFNKYSRSEFKINYDELKVGDKRKIEVEEIYYITNQYVDASDYESLMDRLTNPDRY